MSNFIYNSYCVLHAGPERVTLTADYRPGQDDAPVAQRSNSYSFVWASLVVLALLIGFASAGKGATVLIGMAVWVLALAGWALTQPSVRRAMATARMGLRAWRQSRRQVAEDERTWTAALKDARLMADLSRAMNAQINNR